MSRPIRCESWRCMASARYRVRAVSGLEYALCRSCASDCMGSVRLEVLPEVPRSSTMLWYAEDVERAADELIGEAVRCGDSEVHAEAEWLASKSRELSERIWARVSGGVS